MHPVVRSGLKGWLAGREVWQIKAGPLLRVRHHKWRREWGGLRIDQADHQASSLSICRSPCSGISAFVKRTRSRQDHPGNARKFCCQSDRYLVDAHACSKLIQPHAEPIMRSIEMQDA